MSSLLDLTIFCLTISFLNLKIDGTELNEPNLEITGGDEVVAHSMPFMAIVKTTIDDRPVSCGGSLINSALVLTSARCLYGADKADIIVGAHNLTDSTEASQLINLGTDNFIIHEKYSKSNNAHDIALIYLETALTLDDNVQPIAIPGVNDTFTSYDEKLGTIAGWGKISNTANTTSNVLEYANVTIIPVIICELSYLFSLTPEQMCTSGVSRKNICLGDAGGPLIVDNVQVGIASFGSDFGCDVGFPGVYTRLTSYLDWINYGSATLRARSRERKINGENPKLTNFMT